MIKIPNLDIYQTERNLITWNFKPDERKRILSAIESNPRLKDVFNQSCPLLIQTSYGLTNVQIIVIACGKHGIENLRAFSEYYADLKKFGFNFLHLLQIFYFFEAYQIFPHLHELLPFLIDNRISPIEITSIIKGITKPEDILLNKEHLKSLIDLKISPININFLLKNNLLEQFITYQRSVRSTKKTNQKLNELIRACVSVTQFSLYLASYPSLNALGLNNPSIFALTTAPNAQELIQVIQETFPILMKVGFNIEKLLELGIASNGNQNLNQLIHLAPKLLSYGYTRNDILRLVDHDDGANRLQLLYSKHLEYRCFHYSQIKIFMLVMTEIKNKQEHQSEDELSQYLREIDALREEDSLNEAKASLISIFSSTPNFDRVRTPLFDENSDPLEQGLLMTLKL